MRYKVRYEAASTRYSIVDRLFGSRVIGQFNSEAPAQLQAGLENDRWKKYATPSEFEYLRIRNNG